MFSFFDRVSRAFWSMFDFATSVRLARSVREDPDRQRTSVHFGIRAMICAVSMLVFAVLAGALLFVHLFKIPGLDLALGIALAVGAVLLFAHTIKNWVLQFSLNRTQMTWISLAAVVACIAGSVAMLLVFAFVL